MPPKKKPLERNFDGDYTIKVGDVCYVLIGQIVNRNLAVLRYQPTLGLVVNSPIESPVLAQFVKTDWSGLTTDVHKTSLIADMRSGNDLWEFGPASERLRFYYPASYQYLRQNLYKKKILEFEKDEKANQTPKKASSRRAKKKKRQIKRT